jgi:hypothetical protein
MDEAVVTLEMEPDFRSRAALHDGDDVLPVLFCSDLNLAALPSPVATSCTMNEPPKCAQCPSRL